MTWDNSSQRKCKACRCTHLEPYGCELHLRMAIKVSNEMLSAMISSQPKREDKYFFKINQKYYLLVISVLGYTDLKIQGDKKNLMEIIKTPLDRAAKDITFTRNLMPYRERQRILLAAEENTSVYKFNN